MPLFVLLFLLSTSHPTRADDTQDLLSNKPPSPAATQTETQLQPSCTTVAGDKVYAENPSYDQCRRAEIQKAQKEKDSPHWYNCALGIFNI